MILKANSKCKSKKEKEEAEFKNGICISTKKKNTAQKNQKFLWSREDSTV